MKINNRFMCFSPPVMLATFAIEFVLMAYVIIRYKMTSTTRLAAALLFFLAAFQLAEYMSCGSENFSFWSRFGFVAITALPPLCIHFITKIASRKSPKIVMSSYALGAIFAVIFMIPAAFDSFACTGNYVIFSLVNGLSDFYTFYYYGLLFLGIGMCLHYAPKAEPRIRRALRWQIFGYFSFLLPTAIVNSINPSTTAGIPSIMCGFAVIYALIIVFAILPVSKQPRKK
jgi:hypothetical protein